MRCHEANIQPLCAFCIAKAKLLLGKVKRAIDMVTAKLISGKTLMIPMWFLIILLSSLSFSVKIIHIATLPSYPCYLWEIYDKLFATKCQKTFSLNPLVKMTCQWIDMEWFTPFDEAIISPK